MSYQNEESTEFLIKRYQQKIFALAVYLIGDDKNKVYSITTSAFVKAIQTTSLQEKDEVFLIKLAAAVVEKSKDVKAMPSRDESDFMDLPRVKRKTLQLAKTALMALPFESKVLLLLRDQLHLSYKGIATIFHMPEKNAKIQTTEARIHLRAKIEEVLKNDA